MKKDTILSFDLGNIRIRVALNGFFDFGEKAKSMMHSHAVFELHVILRGSAVMETEDRAVGLSEGDVVLVLPDAFHRFENEEKGTAISSISFSVKEIGSGGSPDYYKLICERIAGERDMVVFEKNTQLTEYFKKIISGAYSHRPFDEEASRALLILFFAELFSSFVVDNDKDFGEIGEGGEYDTRIAIIEEYFNDYYMEDISLKQLASLLYLSEKQTNRMINKAFGVGFREQLNKTRMRSAKKFLRDGEMDITHIAEAVGYQSYNGFYIAFKASVGCTPCEYRRRHQKAKLEEKN